MPSTSTSSEGGAGHFAGQLFDGETAASHDVSLTILEGGIEIADAAAGKVRLWTFSGLEAVNPPRDGHSLRLRHKSEPGTRLIVAPGAGAQALLARAGQLTRRFNPHRLMAHALIVAACVLALLAAGYLVLSFLPQTVADLMPRSMRQRLGESVESSLVKGARVCGGGAGLEALAALDTRLSAGLPDAPRFSVKVVDLPMVNAFAVPGGRIIVSAKLIAQAQKPAEVAGVIAHELGHVYYRHPEAQLVRIMGLQLFLTLATGTSGGDTLGGMAGLLAILRYSRAAEDEADAFAARLLAASHIDPTGLRDFFTRLKKSSGEDSGGVLSGIGDIFSTHPGTGDRIARIKPLAPGAAREVMSPAAFADLKAICE
jgi:Zn-dependent protease with chaperone function